MKVFRNVRERIKESMCRVLSTVWGYRLIARVLEKEDCILLRRCNDHSIAFQPHDFIGEEVFFGGSFQRKRNDEVINFLKSEGICVPDGLLLELGANIGTQTIYIMKHGYFRGAVAIEPDEKNFSILQLNIKINALCDLVHTFQLAVGDTPGVVAMLRKNFNSGASRAKHLEGDTANDPSAVEVMRVDDIMLARDIAVEEVALVWMDIEGYEKKAFAGMKSLVALQTPVYFEYTPSCLSKQDAEALWDMLESSYEDVRCHTCNGLERTSFDSCRDLKRQTDILLF